MLEAKLSMCAHCKVQNRAKQVHRRAHFGEGLFLIRKLMFYSFTKIQQMIW